MSEDNVLDMVKAANEKNPTVFRDAFHKAMASKIDDQLTAKKMETGRNMFQPPAADDGIEHPLEAEIG